MSCSNAKQPIFPLAGKTLPRQLDPHLLTISRSGRIRQAFRRWLGTGPSADRANRRAAIKADPGPPDRARVRSS